MEEMERFLMNILELCLYGRSVEEAFDSVMSEHYFRIHNTMSQSRFRHLLRSLSGCANLDSNAQGSWSFDGKLGTDILQLERRKSKVSREICFIEGVTLLSADEDHVSMGSEVCCQVRRL